jgi:hypothetical protein
MNVSAHCFYLRREAVVWSNLLLDTSAAGWNIAKSQMCSMHGEYNMHRTGGLDEDVVESKGGRVGLLLVQNRGIKMGNALRNY